MAKTSPTYTELRVLYVASVDTSSPDGPGVNEREFISALSSVCGDRLSVVVPRPAFAQPDLPRGTVAYCRRIGRRQPLTFVAHHIEQFWKAWRLLRTGKYDIVCVRLGTMPLAPYLLTRFCSAPVAVKTLGAGTVGSVRRHGRLMRLLETIVGPIENFLVKGVLKRAVAVDACTEQLVQRAVSLGAVRDKVILVGNATNVNRFAPRDATMARRKLGLERFNPVVGYVGGRPWERGGRQIVSLAPRLAERFPHLGIVIVGDGEGMAELHEEARALGVSDRVHFAGLVPYDVVPDYVNCFDVGVALDGHERLSKWGNSYQKVRQYIACGVQVVTNSDPDDMIVGARLGAVVDVRSEKSILEAITGLLGLSDEDKRQHRNRAADYARKHLSTTAAVVRRLNFWVERTNRGAQAELSPYGRAPEHSTSVSHARADGIGTTADSPQIS